jgi:hypothetical protein
MRPKHIFAILLLCSIGLVAVLFLRSAPEKSMAAAGASAAAPGGNPRRGVIGAKGMEDFRTSQPPEIAELRQSLKRMHGGTATFDKSVPVRETVWEGVVHVFDLIGHAIATRAYAWSSPIEERVKRWFLVVLHTDKITSPTFVVRAATVAEHRAGQK